MYNWAKKTQAIPGANILSTQTQSGRVFNAKPGGGGVQVAPGPLELTKKNPLPFTPTPGVVAVFVWPGFFLDVYPSNISDPIEVDPDTEGITRVWIEASLSEGGPSGVQCTSCTIGSGASFPSNAGTGFPSTYYYNLGLIRVGEDGSVSTSSSGSGSVVGAVYLSGANGLSFNLGLSFWRD
jgi:hypothetical protein